MNFNNGLLPLKKKINNVKKLQYNYYSQRRKQMIPLIIIGWPPQYHDN